MCVDQIIDSGVSPTAIVSVDCDLVYTKVGQGGCEGVG